MTISSKGRYALRLMVELAVGGNDYVTLRDISARQQISVKYLEQIALTLSKSGVIRSLRGPNGGYKLAKSPDKYKLGEILRAIEGTLAPINCLNGTTNHCAQYKICPTVQFWEGLQETISNYVDSVTLKDLIDNWKLQR